MTYDRGLTLEPPFEVSEVIVITEDTRTNTRAAVDGGSDNKLVVCAVLRRRLLSRGCHVERILAVVVHLFLFPPQIEPNTFVRDRWGFSQHPGLNLPLRRLRGPEEPVRNILQPLVPSYGYR